MGKRKGAKVIKASELIKLRASLRRHFKRQWGCDIYSQKLVDLGSDDSQRVSAQLSILESLISACKHIKD